MLEAVFVSFLTGDMTQFATVNQWKCYAFLFREGKGVRVGNDIGRRGYIMGNINLITDSFQLKMSKNEKRRFLPRVILLAAAKLLKWEHQVLETCCKSFIFAETWCPFEASKTYSPGFIDLKKSNYFHNSFSRRG